MGLNGCPHTHAHGIAFIRPIERECGNRAINLYKNLHTGKFTCVIAGHD
jgi:hypothetical protein